MKQRDSGVLYITCGDMSDERLTLYLATVMKTLQGSSFKETAMALIEKRTTLPPRPRNFYRVYLKPDEIKDIFEYVRERFSRVLIIVDYLQGLGNWQTQAKFISTYRNLLAEPAGITKSLEPEEPIGNMIYTLFISQIKKRDTSSNKAIRDELFALVDDMSGSKELINMADYILASIGHTRVRVPSLPLLKVLKSRLPDVTLGRYLDYHLNDITSDVEKAIEEFLGK